MHSGEAEGRGSIVERVVQLQHKDQRLVFDQFGKREGGAPIHDSINMTQMLKEKLDVVVPLCC